MNTIHPKASGGVLGGALGIIVVWVLNKYAHADVPGEVGSAIATAIGFAVAYYSPSGDKSG